MTRSEQLADAYEAVARVNHYMVGIVEVVTYDELSDAEQILITRQNDTATKSASFKRIDLALDLIQAAMKAAPTGR